MWLPLWHSHNLYLKRNMHRSDGQSIFQEKGITSKVTLNFREEDLYPPIFSELYYTAVIEDPSVRRVS